MAEQIRNIQIAKRMGQYSLFDMFDAKDLIEEMPCIFDRIDKLVIVDDTWEDTTNTFDPDAD